MALIRFLVEGFRFLVVEIFWREEECKLPPYPLLDYYFTFFVVFEMSQELYFLIVFCYYVNKQNKKTQKIFLIAMKMNICLDCYVDIYPCDVNICANIFCGCIHSKNKNYVNLK